jgi:hypothetical protein
MTRQTPVLLTGAGDTTRNAQNGGSVASSTCAKPANTANGDLLIAAVCLQASGNGNPILETSGDWTLAPGSPIASSTRRQFAWFYLPVPVASAVRAGPWTWSIPTGGANGRWIIRIFRVTGVDLTSPIDVVSTVWDTVSPSSSPTQDTLTAITTVADHSVVLAGTHATSSPSQLNYAPTSFTAGYTQVFLDNATTPDGSAASDSLWVATKSMATPGDTGTVVITAPAQTAIEGYQMSLTGLTSASSTITASPTGIASSEGFGTPTATISNSPVTVSPTGIASLEGFGTPKATWTEIQRWLSQGRNAAHRAGDLEGIGEQNPACWARSYAFGPNLMIEASIWTTLDGVVVLNHNQTTGAVFDSDIDIPSSNYAALTGLRSKVGNWPIARLDTMVAQYGQHRLIMIDNKGATTANMTALLDFCDANGGPSRIMFKGYQTMSASFCTQIRSRGYKLWLYIYTTDAGYNQTTFLTGIAAKCDILGLNWDASASDFAAAKAASPSGTVLAHSATTLAGQNQALANGATALMAGVLTGAIPNDQRSPIGIASSEAFGTPTVSLGGIIATPTGIASVEQFGTPTVNTVLTATPVGIGSGEVFGVPAVSTRITVSPQSVVSGEGFGVPTVSTHLTVTLQGISSAESFGVPTLTTHLTSSPQSISSGEVFGTPVVTLGSAPHPPGSIVQVWDGTKYISAVRLTWTGTEYVQV